MAYVERHPRENAATNAATLSRHAETMDVADFNADGKADIIAAEAEAEAEGGSCSYRVGFSSGSGISSWSKVLGGMSQLRQARRLTTPPRG